MTPGPTTLQTGTAARPETRWAAVRCVLDPRNPAWLVVVASALLSIIGLYGIDLANNLNSAGATDAAQASATKGIILRQVAYIAFGLLAGGLIALPHYRWLGYLSTLAAIPMVAVLAFLLIPQVPEWIVKPHKGARGWINFGVADFQPAEVAKILYVLVIARYLRYRRTHRTLRGLLPLGLITMVPVGLITLQPDLGTAMLFIPSLFAMLVAAGAKLKHLTIIVLVGAAAAPLAYPLLKPHQQQRLIGLWKQITDDKSGDRDINYQSTTAQTLVGAGGAAGVGDARSRALVHFSALPERHNDMIIAVLANRWGMMGVAGILGLYLVWIAGALAVAGRTQDPFARLVAVGLCGFLLAQTFVNVAMNLGIAPIVGVTLPFVSYGGSSMLSAWMMTGLVFSLSVHRPERQMRHAFEFGEE